jgi:hypothetical protein
VLFNSYYQGLGAQHPRAQRGLVTRPTLADVLRYRTTSTPGPGAPRLGPGRRTRPDRRPRLHHEQQHQELLLTDIKHALSCNPQPRLRAALADHTGRAAAAALVRVRRRPHRTRPRPTLDGDFAFDNETPRHWTYTAPFELASRPASYGEYLQFMEDGGYLRPELWLSLGWDWVRSGARTAPLYWRCETAKADPHPPGEVPIDLRTPVCHLSYFERTRMPAGPAAGCRAKSNGSSPRAA